MVKDLPASAGDVRDVGSIPGSERSPGEGNGNPLQYSRLGILVGYMRSMGLQESDMAEYTHGECSNGAFRSLFRNKGHVFLSSGTVAS